MFEKLHKRMISLSEEVDAEVAVDDTFEPDVEEDIVVEPTEKVVSDDIPTDTDGEEVEEDWTSAELSELTEKNKQTNYYAKTSLKGSKTMKTPKTLDEMFAQIFTEDEVNDVPENVDFGKGDKEPENDYAFEDDAEKELAEADEEEVETVDDSEDITDAMAEAFGLFEDDEEDESEEGEDESEEGEDEELAEDDEVVEINVEVPAEEEEGELTVSEEDEETLDAIDSDLEASEEEE